MEKSLRETKCNYFFSLFCFQKKKKKIESNVKPDVVQRTFIWRSDVLGFKDRNTFTATYCVPCFRVSKVLPGVSKGHFILFSCLPTISSVAKESQCFFW